MDKKDTLASFQKKMKEMISKSSEYVKKMQKYSRLETLLHPDKVVEKEEKHGN